MLHKISQRLPFALVACAALVSVGVGAGSYLMAAGSVSELTQRQLTTLATERAQKIGEFLVDSQRDLEATAAYTSTADALANLEDAWTQVPEDPLRTLQTAYIDENPNPADQRYKLDAPQAFLRYNFAHKRFHPQFRAQMLARGYADIYLVDTSGNVIYSVTKQADFATALPEQKGSSGLAEAVAQAMSHAPDEPPVITDIAHYDAIGGHPALFMAVPVFNSEGVRVGVLAYRLGLQRIDTILADARGLGTSGETFLVGEDEFVRSNSSELAGSALSQRFALTIGTLSDPERIINKPIGGRDFRVVLVPVPNDKLRWNVISLLGADEADEPVVQLRNAMLLIGALLLSIVSAIGFLFSRSITRPISRLTSTMSQIAAGAFETEVPGIARSDELGEMASAVEVFRANGEKMVAMGDAERRSQADRSRERSRMMSSLQAGFGAVVQAAIDGDFSRRIDRAFEDDELNALAAGINTLVDRVRDGLAETGDVLAAIADTDLTLRVQGVYRGEFQRLQTNTNAVADRLVQVMTQLQQSSGSVRTATSEILAGSDDLNTRTSRQAVTVADISRAMTRLSDQAVESGRRASSAFASAKGVAQGAEQGRAVSLGANEAMQRITASSAKIASITDIINDIAFQSNLLALNASVEAARAGDAGAGFSVVAVEVRRLAQRTGDAAKEIQTLIADSVREVSSGTRLVAEANSALTEILAAARHTMDLTDSIFRESQVEAAAIEGLTRSVEDLDRMTQDNAALVEETNAAVAQTEAEAQRLDEMVMVFKVTGEGSPAAKQRSAA